MSGPENDSINPDVMEDGPGFCKNYEEYLVAPENIKRRIHAMKNLLNETMKVDKEFYLRLFKLEKEFEAIHQKHFDARAKIVKGEHEPTDEESNWKSTEEDEDTKEFAEMVRQKLNLSETAELSNAKGVPNFWTKVFHHVPHLDAMITPEDTKVLAYLEDVKCLINDDLAEPGFTLQFLFAENPWFTNKMLTKRYFFNYEISEEDPFDYAGPEIVACQGCVIDWQKGKNLTVKQVVKTQRRKNADETRKITKTVEKDSFFNFFNPDKQSAMDEGVDEALLECDFKIGQYFRESIIPRAVVYYTGEAEDEFDDSDDDFESEEDLSMESSDDADEEAMRRRPGARPKGRRPPNSNAGGDQQECKQQ